MRQYNSASRSAVRPVWLDVVVAASQRVAGESQVIDPADAQPMLTAFVRALPAPASVVERLILRALLLDVAWRYGRTAHARAHRGQRGKCSFVPIRCLERFWGAPPQDPEKAFLAWTDAYCAEFARLHPATAASRVARLIRRNYQRRWSLAVLGRRFHVTSSQLRRGFACEFGVSIQKYQQEMRVKAAIREVRKGNIEATALGVGYKGKKNFYHAFRQVTGVTPTAFRCLSEERALHIIDSIGLPLRRESSSAADRTLKKLRDTAPVCRNAARSKVTTSTTSRISPPKRRKL
jgi:AraC-like DNA-binding protein